jgi:hypothetical protein
MKMFVLVEVKEDGKVKNFIAKGRGERLLGALMDLHQQAKGLAWKDILERGIEVVDNEINNEFGLKPAQTNWKNLHGNWFRLYYYPKIKWQKGDDALIDNIGPNLVTYEVCVSRVVNDAQVFVNSYCGKLSSVVTKTDLRPLLL